MNILFLSRWFPFPPDNGSKIRVYHLLKGLSQLHEVTLLSFCESPLPSPDDLKQYSGFSEIQVVPWKPFNHQSVRAGHGFLNSSPRSLIDTYSPQMEFLIRSALVKRKFHVVIASQLSMASYYRAFQGIPALFDEIELGLFYDQAFQDANLIKRLRSKLTWFKLQRYISRILDSFAVGTVVSEPERKIFMDSFSRHQQKIQVLPNCIDMKDYQNITVIPKPCHLIFSGSFRYRPNYHAMQWFIRDVYPLILERVPHAQLIITGDHAGLPLPSMKNVTLAGYVNDIKSLVASCDVSIAPLWSGGGTRLKILEAMALGTPVVATSKGAEGLLIQNGEHILIADEPQLFAEQVIRILQDGDLGRSLSSNALYLAGEHYDWSTVLPKFFGLIDQVAAGQM
ncbi:MAG: glycosyltransferase family 4 protein [Chloroflexota bacterium]